jgi:hypothetical protein
VIRRLRALLGLRHHPARPGGAAPARGHTGWRVPAAREHLFLYPPPPDTGPAQPACGHLGQPAATLAGGELPERCEECARYCYEVLLPQIA